MGRLIQSLIALFLLSGSPACALPLTYSADSIEARVIDAETKEPVPDVVVVANWQLKQGTLGGSVPVGQLMIMETLTDERGVFSFPSWGPKTVWRGHLVNQDPQLLLFKSGYKYRRLVNAYSSDRELRLRQVRRSDWDGKTIELKRFSGTPKEWFDSLERIVPPYDRPEEATSSLILRAILAEENSIPNSVVGKRAFFDNIVRRMLDGRQ